MEDSGAKFSQLIEYAEGIDYVKVAKNTVIVFSFSTVHFFGYIYFAFGSVPPFVDFTSFSSVVFIACGYFAIASLLSRIVAIFFTRFLIPYLEFIFVARRRLQHSRLRRLRREYNGFGTPSDGEMGRRRRERYIDRMLKINDEILLKSEMRDELLIRNLSRVVVFSFLYLGAEIAALCLTAICVYSLFLYMGYFLVQYLAYYIARIPSIKDSMHSRRLLRYFGRAGQHSVHISELLASYQSERRSGETPSADRHIMGFFSVNSGVLLVVLALVFGAGRSAHTLGTESFDIVLMNGGSEEYLSTSIVLITSNGILGVSGADEAMMFVPFDVGPVITPSETDKSDFYIRMLTNVLFLNDV